MLEQIVLAFSAFGLGAAHALEPGHGKTVVGAYLVGSRGRITDAVGLGFVVTFTHTGIVIILGILSMLAAAYFVPAKVQKVLELVSGLLVVLVGAWMIKVRLDAARKPAVSHSHSHGHEHPHVHPHSHEPEDRALTRKGLLALGVSGGIVPCPGALAVLLAAISQGKFLGGVSLVLVFSLGMACTLVAIGILMVKAASLAQRRVSESKWTRIVPLVSACLITLIGVALTVHAVAVF